MLEKEVISGIAGIDDWRGFEEFVKNLYVQNENTVSVIRSYKALGLSGRKREVDVLVKFGFNHHVLSLGVECKYWANKIDGDIIDVAAAKRDDLSLDKYAVITTVGFEEGAKLYAKNKGIDLFLIRPSEDDDFGYSGRIVKVRLCMQGSNPKSIGINAQLLTNPGQESVASEYVGSKFNDIKFEAQPHDVDHELDLYRYSKYVTGAGAVYTKQARLDNFVQLVNKAWQEQNIKFWNKKPTSINQRITFKSPTAMFMRSNIVVLINHIEFKMQYLRTEKYFEIDRGKQYPLVLENVIENAITPLTSNEKYGRVNFTMSSSSPKVEVDLSAKPADAVGRDGVSITVTLEQPMGDPLADGETRTYELISKDDKVSWKEITPS